MPGPWRPHPTYEANFRRGTRDGRSADFPGQLVVGVQAAVRGVQHRVAAVRLGRAGPVDGQLGVDDEMALLAARLEARRPGVGDLPVVVVEASQGLGGLERAAPTVEVVAGDVLDGRALLEVRV